MEFRQVETGHKYVNRLAMTNKNDWVKLLGKEKGCLVARKTVAEI